MRSRLGMGLGLGVLLVGLGACDDSGGSGSAGESSGGETPTSGPDATMSGTTNPVTSSGTTEAGSDSSGAGTSGSTGAGDTSSSSDSTATDGGSSSSGGGSSSTGTEACVAVEEVCNGLDDDCDDVADNGCPASIELLNGGFAGHEIFGNLVGGVAYDDLCPAGSALVGFDGYVGGNIDQIAGSCAPLTLEVDDAVVPYAYSVAAGAATALASHGGNVTTPFSLACPPNEFVVGISGEAGAAGLNDVIIHCAALEISGTPGAFVIQYGAITELLANGANEGDAYEDLLGAPEVVDRFRGRSGAWNDAIGIGSATVSLVPIE